jgi:hypothetical protein
MDAIVPYDSQANQSAYAYARDEASRMEEINERLREYIPIEFYKDEEGGAANPDDKTDVMSMRSIPVSAVSKKTGMSSFTKLTGVKQSVLPSEKALRGDAEKRKTEAELKLIDA